MVSLHQYEVYWISLDPIKGSEMAKTRPCVVVSPDDMNNFLRTIIIMPITSTIKSYPWRINCIVAGKPGSIATEQIRVVDRIRIGKNIGRLSSDEVVHLKDILNKMLIE